jgi:hypothetical protein
MVVDFEIHEPKLCAYASKVGLDACCFCGPDTAEPVVSSRSHGCVDRIVARSDCMFGCGANRALTRPETRTRFDDPRTPFPASPGPTMCRYRTSTPIDVRSHTPNSALAPV